jgi:hypothetical protein
MNKADIDRIYRKLKKQYPNLAALGSPEWVEWTKYHQRDVAEEVMLSWLSGPKRRETMSDKWVERWAVRSSSGHGDYIVGKDEAGNYGCSCRGWTQHMYCPFCNSSIKKGQTACPVCGKVGAWVRHDCAHIVEVKLGRGRSIAEATLDRMLGR